MPAVAAASSTKGERGCSSSSGKGSVLASAGSGGGSGTASSMGVSSEIPPSRPPDISISVSLALDARFSSFLARYSASSAAELNRL